MLKICGRCRKEFEPTSNHKCCPKCRYLAKRRPCPICGLRETVYDRCHDCANSARKNTGRGHKNEDGYVIVRRDGKRGLQHRFVMEANIGRSLEEYETVHHKNGVRDDNRIDNLELWVSKQPAGQRVEDLLEWAKFIIDKYDKGMP